AWQWLDFQFDQLAPDCPRANQPVIGQLESPTQLDHQLLQFRRRQRADRQRSTRVLGKVDIGIGLESRPPFVEPSGRSLQIRTNLVPSLSVEATTNCLTSKLLFRRAHDDASSLREEDHTKRARCCDYGKSLECARCRDCSNAHDVMTIETYWLLTTD